MKKLTFFLIGCFVLYALFSYLVESILDKEEALLYIPATNCVFTFETLQLEERNRWKYLIPFRKRFYYQATNVRYHGKYEELLYKENLKDKDLGKYIDLIAREAGKFEFNINNHYTYEIIYWDNNIENISLPEELEIIKDGLNKEDHYHISEINLVLVTYKGFKFERYEKIENALMLRDYVAARAMILLGVVPSGVNRTNSAWFKSVLNRD